MAHSHTQSDKSTPKQWHYWAAESAGAPLKKQTSEVPQIKNPWDVLIKVHHCGVCHSDIHLLNNDWGISQYPLVPGHEILGTIIQVGSQVSSLQVGDFVGVGWQRTSCMQCPECVSGRENLCSDNDPTCVGHFGGYSNLHISDARFCFKIPNNLQRPEAAPLLCGGATVFSPLAEFVQTPTPASARIGVIGAGGLGHLALKMARAMGYEVFAFSSSPRKFDEIKKWGAHEVINSLDTKQLKSTAHTLDLIISTVNVDMQWNQYLKTLRSDGTLCFVGVPPTALTFHAGELMGKRLRITSSPIASRMRIDEMLKFCSVNNIISECEQHDMSDVNNVITKVKNNAVHFRAVLNLDHQK